VLFGECFASAETTFFRPAPKEGKDAPLKKRGWLIREKQSTKRQILTQTNETGYFYEAVKIWASSNLNDTAARLALPPSFAVVA